LEKFAGIKKEFMWDIFGSRADGLISQIWLDTGRPTSKVAQIMNVASCWQQVVYNLIPFSGVELVNVI